MRLSAYYSVKVDDLCVSCAFFGASRVLSELLADLFSTEGADSVQPKTEHNPVLFPQADVECVVLCSDRTAIPAIANRHGRTDQRAISFSGTRLKVEEE